MTKNHCLRYTPAVTSKKGVIGIGVPLQSHDESRGLSAESAASLSVPPVLAARMGGREARRFPQGLPGTPTRSSCRPRLASRAAVVANRSPWRPFMAHIIPFPNSAAAPVQQRRGAGRHPKMVVSLRNWRALRRAAVATPSDEFLIGMDQGYRDALQHNTGSAPSLQALQQQLASERELLRLFESTTNTVRHKVAFLQQQCSQTPHGR